MRIARLAPADLDSIDPLRRALWPDSPIEELKVRAPAMVADPPAYLVLVARSDEGVPIGFAEVAVRHDYVNGCDSSPVAFLEGIYVDAARRQRGRGVEQPPLRLVEGQRRAHCACSPTGRWK